MPVTEDCVVARKGPPTAAGLGFGLTGAELERYSQVLYSQGLLRGIPSTLILLLQRHFSDICIPANRGKSCQRACCLQTTPDARS